MDVIAVVGDGVYLFVQAERRCNEIEIEYEKATKKRIDNHNRT